MSDIAEDLDAKGGALSTAKDLFAGAVGGVAQVLVGQPFDIVKVRLQTGTAYTSALDAARTIYAQEGALAFYKGTLTPLLGIGACVSIQFGAFGYAKRQFEAANSLRHAAPDLGYAQYYAAGAFAGVANSVVSGPVEHVRIRLQTQPHGAGRLYAGPWDCVRKLSSPEAGGVLRGLYRGQAVTVLREAQAYGMWFLAFEWMMAADLAHTNKKRQQQQQQQDSGAGAAAPLATRADIPSWKVALYGGIAGEALWLGSYPFDVVKSKMQTDGFATSTNTSANTEGGPARMKYRTMRDCFAQTWRAEGARGFWKGIGPTLLRAMPVSACTFATVEATMRFIS